MARKKTIYTPLYREPKGTSGTRIRIPQPAYKPIQLTSRDAVKREDLRPNESSITIHHRGLAMPKLGVDPQEARAVQGVRGSLPERVLYMELIRFGWVMGVDVDFQSSQAGGRNELGGLVADFLFPYLMLVIQVQSYWHGAHMQAERDKQQAQILADMGYQVVYLLDAVILNVYACENALRQTFGLPGFRGAALLQSYIEEQEETEWDVVILRIDQINEWVNEWLA